MFRTTFGGIITLLIVLVVFGVFGLKLKVMINREQSVSKMNSFFFQSNAETNLMSFKENGFSILVSIHDIFRRKYFIDKKYGTFSAINYYQMKKENDSTIYYDFVNVPLSPCNESSILIEGQEKGSVLSIFDLEKYMCPDVDVYIGGLSLSLNYTRLIIDFQACHDEDYCATEEEMEEFYETAQISVMVGDKWFDPSNYEQPLQNYYQNQWRPVDKTKATMLDLWIHNNTVKLSDDLFGISSQEYNFLQLRKNFDIFLQSKGSSVFTPYTVTVIILELSPEKIIYERNVYTLNNLMSDIGGFFNSFLFIGSLLFYAFKEPLLYTQLLSKIYLVAGSDNPAPDKDRRFDFESNRKDNSNRNLFEMQTHPPNRQEQSDLRQKVYNYAKSLQAVKFKTSFLFVMSYLNCKRFQWQKKRDKRIYHLGKRQLLEELDCVNVLRKLRKVDVMYKLLFNENVQKIGMIYNSGVRLRTNSDHDKETLSDNTQSTKMLQDDIAKYIRSEDHERIDSKMNKLLELILSETTQNPGINPDVVTNYKESYKENNRRTRFHGTFDPNIINSQCDQRQNDSKIKAKRKKSSRKSLN